MTVHFLFRGGRRQIGLLFPIGGGEGINLTLHVSNDAGMCRVHLFKKASQGTLEVRCHLRRLQGYS